jgi:hypothetical protein
METNPKGDGMKYGRALITSVLATAVGAGVIGSIAITIAHLQPHQAPLTGAVSTQTVTVKGVSSTVRDVTLRIGTYPNSQFAGQPHGANGGAHPDWVSYSNDNLVVPANSTVTMVVDQYDSGGSLNNSFFGQVRGTIGGTATFSTWGYKGCDPATFSCSSTAMQSAADKGTRTVLTSNQWPFYSVGHTFTLRSTGNAPYLFVSVPLPANFADGSGNFFGPQFTSGSSSYPSQHTVVTFSFHVAGPGVYQWNCEYPCGVKVGDFGEAMSTYGYMSGTLTVK